MVSHDLRNPLFLIKGAAELMRDHVEHAGGQRQDLISNLERIERAVGQADRVVDDLVDLLRLQAGREVVLEKAPADLVALARRAVELHGYNTDVHRILLRTELPALFGEWDERRLERVLANLLTNAIKYTPAGRGDIVVEVSVAERCAVLSVADQGLGIPPGDLPRIFEPFYRGQAVDGVIPGAGIGLTSVLHTVEQHGGTIEVHSRVGSGTTFVVHLPL
jgi:signal transduction histidine kinase